MGRYSIDRCVYCLNLQSSTDGVLTQRDAAQEMGKQRLLRMESIVGLRE